MKKWFVRTAATAASLILCAASLSGCISGYVTGKVIGETGKAVGSAVKEDLEAEFSSDDWGWGYGLANGIASDVMDSLPPMEELINSSNRPDDYRETYEYTGEGEAILSIRSVNASQVIIKQGAQEDDAYTFEYDPGKFQVTPVPGGDILTLDVQMSAKQPRDNEGNYKCIITLPERRFKQIQIGAKDTGIALVDVTSPMSLESEASALALANPRGDVAIRNSDGAFAADISADYASRFTYDGENGAFSLRFPSGEPSPLQFHMEASDSAIAHPTHWGKAMGSFDYESGRGGAVFDFIVTGSAGAITVNEADS